MAFREIDDDLWEIIRKHLPRQKPHIGRPRRDPRSLINGIFSLLTIGCAWNDVPAQYGTKSTVHRYHLELCERGNVSGDLSRPPSIRLRSAEARSRSRHHRYQGDSREKGGNIGFDGYKKVKGTKLSALVDRNGLPVACRVAPANIHDSRLFVPTVAAFEIPGTNEKPTAISANAAYDSREIWQYTRKRGVKSNIPVNPRRRNHPKRGRPLWFDRDLYQQRGGR